MSSVLRSFAVFSFLAAVAITSAPGCSQQGEGERCDSAKNGDLDCDDGLVCIKATLLKHGEADRCCPAESTEGGELCTRNGTETPDPGTGGSAGTAGKGAGGAAAGQGAGGVPDSSGGSSTSQGGMSGGVPGVDGGAPAAGATTGGAGNTSSGGQGGAD